MDMKYHTLSAVGLALSMCVATSQAQDPVNASPSWARALPNGPDTRVKITEEYAKLVGRDAYFWAWPLVNMYNRRLVSVPVKESSRPGPLIAAPLNQLTML